MKNKKPRKQAINEAIKTPEGKRVMEGNGSTMDMINVIFHAQLIEEMYQLTEDENTKQD